MAKMRLAKMRSWIALAVSLCLVVGLGWGQQLTVIWPDIEQGACTLIVGPDGTGVLIDAGTLLGRTPDEPVVPWLISFKEANPDLRLLYIIVTHYHQDHICWIADVIAEGLLDRDAVVYDRGGSYCKTPYTLYARSIAEAVIPRNMVTVGQTIALGDGATLRCLEPPDTPIDNCDSNRENALSLGFLLAYRDFQLWIGGDVGEPEEHAVSTHIGDVDVYVVHHHGSAGSSSREFLDAIKPEVSVFQVGANTYSHPTSTALTRILRAPTTTSRAPIAILQNRGAYTDTCDNVYIADPDSDTGGQPGTMTLLTDGYSYTIEAAGFPETLCLFTDSIPDRASPTEAVRIVRVPDACTVVLGNFTDKPIPIGGWNLRDNTAYFMIPAGTFIPARRTYTVRVTVCAPSKFWVAQQGDYVLLYDTHGVLVDRWEGRPAP